MADTEALNAIHAAFAVAAEWTQDGFVVANITVIPFHDAGDDPIGVGRSVRQKGYEVRKADLPFRPANGDQVNAQTKIWRVIDTMDYEEADAWRVMVERT